MKNNKGGREPHRGKRNAGHRIGELVLSAGTGSGRQGKRPEIQEDEKLNSSKNQQKQKKNPQWGGYNNATGQSDPGKDHVCLFVPPKSPVKRKVG